MPKHLRPWMRFTVTPPEGGTPPADPPAPTPTPPATGANGFPENTPVKDMTAEQQAAYHQHHARKHEGRSKEKDGEIADLRRQLEEAKKGPKSDADKAIDERVAAVLAPLTVDLVSARIEAAVARRGIETTPEAEGTVWPLIEALDVQRFLKDGKPDPERIAAWAAALPAPATGTPTAPGAPQRPATGQFPQGRGRGADAPPRDMAAEYKADKDRTAANPFT